MVFELIQHSQQCPHLVITFNLEITSNEDSWPDTFRIIVGCTPSVVSDLEGDGETDIAIYRAASGVWWIRPSSTGTPYPVGFGGHSSDIPTPGDYDGDGETDIAIYRAASGVWGITPSSTGTPYAVGFGGHFSDIPAPGDYDGDGETDIAIYRAASGVWWILPSSTGTPYAVGFGGDPSDMPVNPSCIHLY